MGRFETFGETKLDRKDKLLLAELDFDSRQSLASLAKKLGMSKRGVEYKMRNLEKEGVILGYYPVINMPRLGYLYCRFVFSLRNTTPKKEAELFDYLVKDPRFFWVFRLQGAADVGVVMWAKSIRDFKRAVYEITEKYGEYMHNENETVTYDVIHYQHRFLIGESDTKEIHIAETSEREELDATDKAILKALSDDARMPTVQIADKVGASPRVVSYRIKAMEKKGIIEAYRVNVDHKKLGFVWYKLYIQSTHNHDELVAFVKQKPAAVYVVEGSGLPADLDVEIVVKSVLDIYKFVNELRAAFPGEIGAYESLMLAEVKKVRYFPF
jgi:Lrp/AsnC family leucine-responsive transcriptional regulator